MTREEAVKALIDMANALCLNPDTPQGMTLKMAIKALEEQESYIEDIKAEIKGLIEEYDARCERFHYKPYKSTKGFPENGVAPRSPIEIESNKWGERAEGLERALKIIDKHINGKESEEQL